MMLGNRNNTAQPASFRPSVQKVRLIGVDAETLTPGPPTTFEMNLAASGLPAALASFEKRVDFQLGGLHRVNHGFLAEVSEFHLPIEDGRCF